MSWLPPLRPTFEAALRDVNARRVESRLAAAERLGEPDAGREDEARDALLALSRDRDARVRGACLLALRELGGEAAFGRLLRGLQDEQPHVRELAALALVEWGGERVEPALRDALSSEHAEVRFQAALGYAELPDAALHVDALAALLEDSDAKVRKAAALSLAQLDDARGAPQLVAALSDSDFALDALDALAKLGHPTDREPIAQIAERVLVAPLLKAAAARALLRLGDARGVPALREVLRGLRNEARSYAVEAIGELRVQELAGELQRLARRSRGVDPLILTDALAALAPVSEEARDGLHKMARRRDAAGARAREALNQM